MEVVNWTLGTLFWVLMKRDLKTWQLLLVKPSLHIIELQVRPLMNHPSRWFMAKTPSIPLISYPSTKKRCNPKLAKA